jgi:hypothetical protein
MKSFDTVEEKRIDELTVAVMSHAIAYQATILGRNEDGMSDECEYAYAMLTAAVCADKGDNWESFLREALDEVIYIQNIKEETIQ